ncbi:MAG: hypothetical protein ABSF48_16905 [Thermodesulfobacteriota bacterium]|jgi:hypothetical protein
MTKKTMDLIIAIIAFATEVLVVIKDKMKGRKGNDDKADTEKK